MKSKKIILISLIIIFITGGCARLGFDNQEEAEKYVLQRLNDKYGEEFRINSIINYKKEKIGLKWIQAEVKTDGQKDIYQISARNTGRFRDSYHISFFKDKLYKKVEPLCQNKDYIQKYKIEIWGHLSQSEWTGKESLEEYIKKEEYTIELEIDLPEGQAEEQYVEEIADWLTELSKTDYNIRARAKEGKDGLIIFDEELGGINKEKCERLKENLKENIQHTKGSSIRDRKYEEWKKNNNK